MAARTDKAIPAHPLDWMPKPVWGPMKWKELHCRALCYLPMDGEAAWFDSFVESIPCPKCRRHFQSFLEQHPFFCPDPMVPDKSYNAKLTRIDFFRWTVDAHNFVNRALQKPEIDYREALLLHMDQWLVAKSVTGSQSP